MKCFSSISANNVKDDSKQWAILLLLVRATNYAFFEDNRLRGGNTWEAILIDTFTLYQWNLGVFFVKGTMKPSVKN